MSFDKMYNAGRIYNSNEPEQAIFFVTNRFEGVFSYFQKLTFQYQRKKRKSVKLIEGDKGYFCDS